MIAAVPELTNTIPTLYIVFDEDDILLMLFYFTVVRSEGNCHQWENENS